VHAESFLGTPETSKRLRSGLFRPRQTSGDRERFSVWSVTLSKAELLPCGVGSERHHGKQLLALEASVGRRAGSWHLLCCRVQVCLLVGREDAHLRAQLQAMPAGYGCQAPDSG